MGLKTPKFFLALRAATLLFGIFDLQGKYLIFLAAEGGEKFLGLLTKINRRRRRRKIFGVLDPRTHVRSKIGPLGGGKYPFLLE